MKSQFIWAFWFLYDIYEIILFCSGFFLYISFFKWWFHVPLVDFDILICCFFSIFKNPFVPFSLYSWVGQLIYSSLGTWLVQQIQKIHFFAFCIISTYGFCRPKNSFWRKIAFNLSYQSQRFPSYSLVFIERFWCPRCLYSTFLILQSFFFVCICFTCAESSVFFVLVPFLWSVFVCLLLFLIPDDTCWHHPLLCASI